MTMAWSYLIAFLAQRFHGCPCTDTAQQRMQNLWKERMKHTRNKGETTTRSMRLCRVVMANTHISPVRMLDKPSSLAANSRAVSDTLPRTHFGKTWCPRVFWPGRTFTCGISTYCSQYRQLLCIFAQPKDRMGSLLLVVPLYQPF